MNVQAYAKTTLTHGEVNYYLLKPSKDTGYSSNSCLEERGVIRSNVCIVIKYYKVERTLLKCP